jgi:hypothetical protein
LNTNSLHRFTTNPFEKKPTVIRPLLLDAQGREIDERGNLVKTETVLPVKTLAANLAAANAMKKKENPYLAHRNIHHHITTNNTTNNKFSNSPEQVVIPIDNTPNSNNNNNNNNNNAATVSATTNTFEDDRLITIQHRRDLKGKRALHFVEPGKYIQENEDDKEYLSRFRITRHCTGESAQTWWEYIEPLSIHARHPFALGECWHPHFIDQTFVYNGTVPKTPLLSLDYILLQTPSDLTGRHANTSLIRHSSRIPSTFGHEVFLFDEMDVI